MKDLIEKFTKEDLPNKGLQELSDVIGINQVKAMLVKLPGVTIHVPKSLYKKSDLEYIKEHIDDAPEDIAEKTGCSLRTVYRKIEAIKRTPSPSSNA